MFLSNLPHSLCKLVGLCLSLFLPLSWSFPPSLSDFLWLGFSLSFSAYSLHLSLCLCSCSFCLCLSSLPSLPHHPLPLPLPAQPLSISLPLCLSGFLSLSFCLYFVFSVSLSWLSLFFFPGLTNIVSSDRNPGHAGFVGHCYFFCSEHRSLPYLPTAPPLPQVLKQGAARGLGRGEPSPQNCRSARSCLCVYPCVYGQCQKTLCLGEGERGSCQCLYSAGPCCCSREMNQIRHRGEAPWKGIVPAGKGMTSLGSPLNRGAPPACAWAGGCRWEERDLK